MTDSPRSIPEGHSIFVGGGGLHVAPFLQSMSMYAEQVPSAASVTVQLRWYEGALPVRAGSGSGAGGGAVSVGGGVVCGGGAVSVGGGGAGSAVSVVGGGGGGLVCVRVAVRGGGSRGVVAGAGAGSTMHAGATAIVITRGAAKLRRGLRDACMARRYTNLARYGRTTTFPQLARLSSASSAAGSSASGSSFHTIGATSPRET